MNGIGDRLREERERLGLSQAVFGELGGVKANAQGNYEKGERFPDAAYLQAVFERGVDVLYVVTGIRMPMPADSISAEEADLLKKYRTLPAADRAGATRVVTGLAELAGRYDVS